MLCFFDWYIILNQVACFKIPFTIYFFSSLFFFLFPPSLERWLGHWSVNIRYIRSMKEIQIRTFMISEYLSSNGLVYLNSDKILSFSCGHFNRGVYTSLFVWTWTVPSCFPHICMYTKLSLVIPTTRENFHSKLGDAG